MNWQKAKEQIKLKVVHREVDLLIVQYERYVNHDSWVYNKIAVFERRHSDTPKEYRWEKVYSTYPVELDIYDHSRMDWQMLNKTLDSLYNGKNTYTCKAH
jgi:hypothetical protein